MDKMLRLWDIKFDATVPSALKNKALEHLKDHQQVSYVPSSDWSKKFALYFDCEDGEIKTMNEHYWKETGKKDKVFLAEVEYI